MNIKENSVGKSGTVVLLLTFSFGYKLLTGVTYKKSNDNKLSLFDELTGQYICNCEGKNINKSYLKTLEHASELRKISIVSVTPHINTEKLVMNNNDKIQYFINTLKSFINEKNHDLLGMFCIENIFTINDLVQYHALLLNQDLPIPYDDATMISNGRVKAPTKP